MKVQYKILYFFVLNLFFSITAQQNNRLNDFVIMPNNLCIELEFNFDNYINCKPQLIEKNKLNLIFSHVTKESFNSIMVSKKLAFLQENDIIKQFHVHPYENNGTPYISLTMSFNTTQKPEKNKFVIKYNKRDTRVILNIFNNEALNNINKERPIILTAQNEIKKPLRIIIDPGHGGADTGAKGAYKLVEKDISLLIARNVATMLRQTGHKILLTRSIDKDLTHTERVQFANSLEADLFVSVHLNASASNQDNVCGVETFYVDKKAFSTQNNNNARFFFINIAKKDKWISCIEKYTENIINQSKDLAGCIQDELITTLQENTNDIVNRGIKSGGYRVLLQLPRPSALVEVGFITNKKEARRLASKYYRNLIASSICLGIMRHIKKMS